MDPDTQHTELNQRKWDLRAATFDQKRFDYFRWMQRWVIHQVDLKPGVHFLDIGCGTGWAVRSVAARLRCQGEFYGIDVSAAMIAKAQAHSQDFPNVHFYQASAEQLPLPGGTIDRAICTNSFHHYFDPARALAEIRRVLAPGGRLYIMDLTSDDFLMRFIDARARKKEREHVKFYSSREFRRLFAAARLTYLGSHWLLYPNKVHVAQAPG